MPQSAIDKLMSGLATESYYHMIFETSLKN